MQQLSKCFSPVSLFSGFLLFSPFLSFRRIPVFQAAPLSLLLSNSCYLAWSGGEVSFKLLHILLGNLCSDADILPLSATRCFLCTPTTARTSFSSTATFATIQTFTFECCVNHCPCATDTALYFDCLDRAIQGTCSTFHTCRWLYEFSMFFSFGKNSMGTDLRAAAAVWMIFERVLKIRIKHSDHLH